MIEREQRIFLQEGEPCVYRLSVDNGTDDSLRRKSPGGPWIMHFGGCNGRYVVQGVMLCIFNKRQQLWLSYSSRPHTRLSSLFSLSSVGVTPFAGRKKGRQWDYHTSKNWSWSRWRRTFCLSTCPTQKTTVVLLQEKWAEERKFMLDLISKVREKKLYRQAGQHFFMYMHS